MGMYVALFGINVGGRNLIKMPALKACFEAGGFEDVATYIQSGNVLFRTGESGSASTLARRIEQMLSAAFGYRASGVVRSHSQMRAAVEGSPEGFGEDPTMYRYDVIFLEEPHGEGRPEKRPQERGGGRGVRGTGRTLLLEGHQPSGAEPPQQGRLRAHLPEEDHPKLEHDHEVAADDGRGIRAEGLCQWEGRPMTAVVIRLGEVQRQTVCQFATPAFEGRVLESFGRQRLMVSIGARLRQVTPAKVENRGACS